MIVSHTFISSIEDIDKREVFILLNYTLKSIFTVLYIFIVSLAKPLVARLFKSKT